MSGRIRNRRCSTQAVYGFDPLRTTDHFRLRFRTTIVTTVTTAIATMLKMIASGFPWKPAPAARGTVSANRVVGGSGSYGVEALEQVGRGRAFGECIA